MAKRAQAPPPNLSANEIKALGKLSHKRDMVINPAEKGQRGSNYGQTRVCTGGLKAVRGCEFLFKATSPYFSRYNSSDTANSTGFSSRGFNLPATGQVFGGGIQPEAKEILFVAESP